MTDHYTEAERLLGSGHEDLDRARYAMEAAQVHATLAEVDATRHATRTIVEERDAVTAARQAIRERDEARRKLHVAIRQDSQARREGIELLERAEAAERRLRYITAECDAVRFPCHGGDACAGPLAEIRAVASGQKPDDEIAEPASREPETADRGGGEAGQEFHDGDRVAWHHGKGVENGTVDVACHAGKTLLRLDNGKRVWVHPEAVTPIGEREGDR